LIHTAPAVVIAKSQWHLQLCLEQPGKVGALLPLGISSSKSGDQTMENGDFIIQILIIGRLL